MSHFRHTYGSRHIASQEVGWYENTTNYDGWLSLHANLKLGPLRVYCRAWFNRIEDEERTPGTERSIEVTYSWRLFGRWRDLRLGWTWRYGDFKPAELASRRYQDCRHVRKAA